MVENFWLVTTSAFAPDVWPWTVLPLNRDETIATSEYVGFNCKELILLFKTNYSPNTLEPSW